MGKGRMVTKPEIERHKYVNMTCEEALPHVAKMIALSHKESKEKRFEFEASWICDATNGQHKIIAKDSRRTLEKLAEDQIQTEMMEEK
jgi:20S proteasome subunit alpha 7